MREPIDDETKPVVAILGFLDTKLQEHRLVYERLTALNCNAKIFDLSVRVRIICKSRYVCWIGRI